MKAITELKKRRPHHEVAFLKFVSFQINFLQILSFYAQTESVGKTCQDLISPRHKKRIAFVDMIVY